MRRRILTGTVDTCPIARYRDCMSTDTKIRCSRPGGEKRGNSKDRRARKIWMLSSVSGFGGDGTQVRCVHCDRWLTYDTVEADRIVPGSKGGTYRRENVQPGCRQCNASRSDNEEWSYATHRAPVLALVG